MLNYSLLSTYEYIRCPIKTIKYSLDVNYACEASIHEIKEDPQNG